MEDFFFKILNPILVFIFWIIIDKERFLITWSIFFTFNICKKNFSQMGQILQ